MDIENYKKINNQYKKVLVFHFGSEAGFYSEYNYMLKAMAFCLVKGIHFKLYSKDSQLCLGNGWQDYFAPFIDEENDTIHSKINYRKPNDNRTAFLWKYVKRKIRQILGIKVNELTFSIYDNYIKNRKIKRKLGVKYFTYELWNDFSSIKMKEKVNIKGLFVGTYFELLQELDKMIWKYNLEMNQLISSFKDKVVFDGDYVGLHVRRGDKIIENTVYPINDYISMLDKLKIKIHNIFVFTDDYTVMTALRDKYPIFNIQTLCPLNDRGYYLKNIYEEKEDIKKERIARMFASMELLKESKIFIGTQSANPYFNIQLYRNNEDMYSIDYGNC